MQPYLTVKGRFLFVERLAKGVDGKYPLTKKGLRQAGRDLYGHKHAHWLYSSSCDCDTKVDVRGLVEGGWGEQEQERERIGFGTESKMFDHCDCEPFLRTLTADERAYFELIRAKVEAQRG